jgi:hypothetical protein
MALELIPLGNIIGNGELTTIAIQLHDRISRSETKRLFQSRHLHGFIKRHGGDAKGPEQKITAARQLHTAGKLGVYVLKDSKQYIGMATVDPNPVLKKQVFSIPAKFARGPLSTDVDLPGPEVSAWVSPGHGPTGQNNLATAYEQLSDTDGIASTLHSKFIEQHHFDEAIRPWTIEPHDAPQWVHTAIRRAGFLYEGQNAGYYYDAESPKQSPPMSRLYVAAHN